jgi:hypothetical protein
MKNTRIILYFSIISFTLAFVLPGSSHRSLKKGKTDNAQSSNSNHMITNVKNLFTCITENNCYLIKEYKIATDNTFSCYDLNIMIELPTLRNLTEENKIPFGFLTRDRSVVDSQETTSTCHRIKRCYFLINIKFY